VGERQVGANVNAGGGKGKDFRGYVRQFFATLGFVCLFVWPIFAKFLCMLPVAMARFSSDGVAICEILPVLWMTSCFHSMGPMGQFQA